MVPASEKLVSEENRIKFFKNLHNFVDKDEIVLDNVIFN